MYYISGLRGRRLEVTDTDDGAVDVMTSTEVMLAERQGYKIHGIWHVKGNVYFTPYNKDLLRLLQMEKGTPVCVRLSKGLGFKQTLYLGHELKDGKDAFYFFDDSGMSGYFGFSSQYIIESGVALNFDDNDANRCAVLTRRLKDGGF